MMSILAETGFEAASPAGAYYVMADCSHLGLGDDVAIATAPGRTGGRGHACRVRRSSRRPEDGAHLVRFAFCKTLATLEAAGERLRSLR